MRLQTCEERHLKLIKPDTHPTGRLESKNVGLQVMPPIFIQKLHLQLQ